MNTYYKPNTANSCLSLLQERKRKILQEFENIKNSDDYYIFLVKKGNDSPPFPETIEKNNYKITGCQYTLWIYIEVVSGCLNIYTDSDSKMIKGILSLYQQFFSGLPAEAIIEEDLEFSNNSIMAQEISSRYSSLIKNFKHKIKTFALTEKRHIDNNNN